MAATARKHTKTPKLEPPAGSGVRRFDYGRARGWTARIRRGAGSYSKLFSDGVHGGREKALVAALQWRLLMERKLPDSQKRSSDLGKRGNIYEINRTEYSRNGTPYLAHAFEARLVHEQTTYCRSFSVQKWGLRSAKRLARAVLDSWRTDLVNGRLPDREVMLDV